MSRPLSTNWIGAFSFQGLQACAIQHSSHLDRSNKPTGGPFATGLSRDRVWTGNADSSCDLRSSMDNRSLGWGAGFLFVAVACGAFGAHALKAVLDPDQLAQWHTAVQYQFYHGIGLLFLALAGERSSHKWRRAIRMLFVAGVWLFCGSVYLLSTREILGIGYAARFLGPITPLGGLCFLAGWGLLLITALRGTDEN